MSSEATPEIFEQHRRLKTRAEEYLIKPFAIEELLDKVSTLVDFPTGDEGRDLQDVTVEDSGFGLGGLPEASPSAGDAHLAQQQVPDGEVMASEADPTFIVDQEIDLATDAAFAALELDEAGPGDTTSTDSAVPAVDASVPVSPEPEVAVADAYVAPPADVATEPAEPEAESDAGLHAGTAEEPEAVAPRS
jgi:hypothetical protein